MNTSPERLRALAGSRRASDHVALANALLNAVEAGSLGLVSEVNGIRLLVDSSRHFPDRQEVQESCMSTLSAVAGTTDENRMAMSACGAVEHMVKTAAARSSSADIQHAAARALLFLTCSVAEQGSVPIYGGVQMLVAASEAHLADAALQQNVAGVLLNLARLDANRLHIRQCGAVRCLVSASAAHVGNIAVQQNVTGALRNLARLEANKIYMCKRGVVACLVAAGQHVDVVGVQQNVAGTIQNLANLPETHPFLVDCGAVECVVAASAAHRRDEGVQKCVAGALFNLALQEGSRELLRERGALECLVTAARDHSANAGVQEYVVGALCNLSMNDGNQPYVVARRGVERMLAVAVAHPRNATIQEHVACALRHLARQEANRAHVRDCGGIELLIAAADAHCDSAAVQQHVAAALRNLTCLEDNKAYVRARGGVQCLVAAGAAHRGDAAVQEHVAGALQNLAHLDDNKAFLVEQGAVQCLVAAAAAHDASPAVAERVTGALRALAELDENKLTIAASGGIECLVRAAVSHPGSPAVARYAVGGLLNLAVHDANKRRLCGADVVDMLLSCAATHARNTGVLELVASTLIHLAALEENAVPLRARGAAACLEALKGPLRQHAAEIDAALAQIAGDGAAKEKTVVAPPPVEPADETTIDATVPFPSILAAPAMHAVPWEEVALGDKLGAGSFGQVFRASFRLTTVAVKVFDNVRTAERVQEIVNEVNILMTLRHPHCVPCMGVVTGADKRIGVMTEFALGGDLDSALKRERKGGPRVTPHQKLEQLIGIVLGLHYLHSTPVRVHRDVKPANILLCDAEHRVAKIADFGLSGDRRGGCTYRYAAPEAVRGRSAVAATDVYAIGCVIYEVFTLRRPFEWLDDAKKRKAPLNAEDPPASPEGREALARLPPALVDLVERCWLPGPAERPTTEEIVTCLRAIQASLVDREFPAAASSAKP